MEATSPATNSSDPVIDAFSKAPTTSAVLITTVSIVLRIGKSRVFNIFAAGAGKCFDKFIKGREETGVL